MLEFLSFLFPSLGNTIGKAAVLLAVCSTVVLADDVLTVDFPITSPVASLPVRLAAAPCQVATPDRNGYAEFSLLPIQDERDLLVTVVFKEDGDKGPSLFWINEGSAQQISLSEDLAEGVKGVNQRSILIPREASAQSGRLILHGDQSKILRVRLDWVPLRKIFAAADQRPVAFLLSDRFLQDTELTGSKILSPPDIWFGNILEASLQEEPESLAENVEFVVPLDQPVAQAVFTVKVLGLPLDKTVEIWINGTRAGQLQSAIPSLSDPGYLKDESGKPFYAGWRGGALHIRADLLKSGDNSIVIVRPGGETFLRDAALQLRAEGGSESLPAQEIVAGQP